MSLGKEDGTDVRNVIDFSLNPVKRFTLMIAIAQYFYVHNYWFQGSGNLIDAFMNLNAFLEDGHKEYKGKVPKSLNPEKMRKIFQLWNGTDYLGNSRPIYLKQKMAYGGGEILSQEIAYDDMGMKSGYRQFEIPSIRYLSPKSDTKDTDTNKIIIQAEMEFRIAWEGFDPEYLASVEGYEYRYSDGNIPFYETDSDVMQAEEMTNIISKTTYNKLMSILVPNFNALRYPLVNEYATILNKMKNMYSEIRNDLGTDTLETELQ